MQKQTPKPALSTPVEQRYYAAFDFSVLEGVMRINGPVASGKQKTCAMTHRWRGRETGESVIAVGSDELLLKMVFSKHGTAVSGDFEGGCVEPVTFTGMKVVAGNNQESSRKDEWRDLSARAYERARVNRWR